MRRILGTAVSAALALSVLAGCDAAAPATTASPSPTPTTAAPRATPSPTATSDALVLSTAGLGPLRMGSPVPSGTSLVAWDPRGCGSRDGSGSDPGGLWIAENDAIGTSPFDRRLPFSLVTEGRTQIGGIRFLQVWSSQYRTPSGLHVGSTDAEVRAALPKASVIDTGQSHEYSVVSAGWRITFSVAELAGGPITDASPVAVVSVAPASDREVTYIATDGSSYCDPAGA